MRALVAAAAAPGFHCCGLDNNLRTRFRSVAGNVSNILAAPSGVCDAFVNASIVFVPMRVFVAEKLELGI